LTTPSQSDIQSTRKLGAALALFEIEVIDHLIVGTDATSMRDLGLI